MPSEFFLLGAAVGLTNWDSLEAIYTGGTVYSIQVAQSKQHLPQPLGEAELVKEP